MEERGGRARTLRRPCTKRERRREARGGAKPTRKTSVRCNKSASTPQETFSARSQYTCKPTMNKTHPTLPDAASNPHEFRHPSPLPGAVGVQGSTWLARPRSRARRCRPGIRAASRPPGRTAGVAPPAPRAPPWTHGSPTAVAPGAIEAAAAVGGWLPRLQQEKAQELTLEEKTFPHLQWAFSARNPLPLTTRSEPSTTDYSFGA